MYYKKLVVQHKKKFFYILGTLFILNLVLLVSNRGVLIGETCFAKTSRDKFYKEISCNQMRKERPTDNYLLCKYLVGRGTDTAMRANDYCNFTTRIDEIY